MRVSLIVFFERWYLSLLASQKEKRGGEKEKQRFSYGDEKCGIVCYVPLEHQKTLTAEAWCGEIVGELGGTVIEGATPELAKGEIAGDGKDKFPIKLKDEALQASIKFLIKIGVFPDKDSDSDEMIFGDDDFPS